MAAGTAYAKRYGGGFLDTPNLTTPVDQTFLNAVEVALLQLIGAAPTADGQVAQWDNANTRFGPALILNKNIDAAAAIAKSKLDLTGANGIVDADVSGAAAIARSKLNFGSGLVNADIAAAAAIVLSKLAGYPTDATKFARGDGSWAHTPGTTEAFQNRTTNMTVNTVAEAAATTFITLPAYVHDGTTQFAVEFYCPAVVWGGAGVLGGVNVWAALNGGGAIDQGRLIDMTVVGNAAGNYPVGTTRVRLGALAAGSYVFSIRAWAGAANFSIQAGTGSAGTPLPAFACVTREV